MQQHERTFDELGIRILVVTFEATPFARAYLEETRLPWPVLIDEERRLYRGYGMHHAGLWDLWGPNTWWAYAKEFARGRLPKLPRADTAQRGGDVLVDPSGIIRFQHVGSGPADRPSIDAILNARRGR